MLHLTYLKNGVMGYLRKILRLLSSTWKSWMILKLFTTSAQTITILMWIVKMHSKMQSIYSRGILPDQWYSLKKEFTLTMKINKLKKKSMEKIFHSITYRTYLNFLQVKQKNFTFFQRTFQNQSIQIYQQCMISKSKVIIRRKSLSKVQESKDTSSSQELLIIHLLYLANYYPIAVLILKLKEANQQINSMM